MVVQISRTETLSQVKEKGRVGDWLDGSPYIMNRETPETPNK